MKPNFDPVIEECIKEARANLYMVRTSRQQEYLTVTGFLLMLLLSSLITSSPRLTIV